MTKITKHHVNIFKNVFFLCFQQINTCCSVGFKQKRERCNPFPLIVFIVPVKLFVFFQQQPPTAGLPLLRAQNSRGNQIPE